ncbi:hypothetical protein BDQ12DRAFT_127215 [Crucibulum laeve]|uniref:F-box domain-containing protein n=1 Tax=Crucibulum laeve TaxID=68775 RepID=A0A5C3MAS9_9AGAR|nr:hypothetical protein BDQ12DRAFT_127215 [Crucibulum laeve]
MPTKRPSKRQKTSVAPASKVSEPQVPTEKATTGKSKALELPIEILTEILSYFRTMIIPHPNDNETFPPIYQSHTVERPRALRALAQTCHLWRFMLYSLLWEHAVCISVYSEKIGNRLRCLSAFFRNHLTEASLVRALTIKLPSTAYSHVTPLQEVVRLLKVLKNLHTLQILPNDITITALKNAFKKHTFPNIKTIILPPRAYCSIILQSCKNVRTVICEYMAPLLPVIEKNCKAVEAIGGWICSEWIIKVLPGLRSIMIPAYFHSADLIRSLRPLENLCYIELLTETIADPANIHSCAGLDACIKEAKLLLRGRTGKKSLMVIRPTFPHSSVSPWAKSISLNTD